MVKLSVCLFILSFKLSLYILRKGIIKNSAFILVIYLASLERLWMLCSKWTVDFGLVERFRWNIYSARVPIFRCPRRRQEPPRQRDLDDLSPPPSNTGYSGGWIRLLSSVYVTLGWRHRMVCGSVTFVPEIIACAVLKQFIIIESS